MRPHDVISNSGWNLSSQACSQTYPGEEKKKEKIGINTCQTYAASSCYKMKTLTIIVLLNAAESYLLLHLRAITIVAL